MKYYLLGFFFLNRCQNLTSNGWLENPKDRLPETAAVGFENEGPDSSTLTWARNLQHTAKNWFLRQVFLCTQGNERRLRAISPDH